jgi:hypothetical protein
MQSGLRPARQRTFTVEVMYYLPVYKHVIVKARSADDACQKGVEDDDWENTKEDYDGSGAVFITGIWMGSEPYCGKPLPISLQFRNGRDEAFRLVREIATTKNVPHDLVDQCMSIASLFE